MLYCLIMHNIHAKNIILTFLGALWGIFWVIGIKGAEFSTFYCFRLQKHRLNVTKMLKSLLKVLITKALAYWKINTEYSDFGSKKHKNRIFCRIFIRNLSYIRINILIIKKSPKIISGIFLYFYIKETNKTNTW